MTNSRHPKPASGVYAALATPRRAHAIEVDTAALFEYLDAVSRSGVDGVVLFGSTGEFIHFSLDERIRATALAIRRSRVPVLVNASHSSLAGAIEIAEAALQAGAGGLLLTPPYFYAYSDAQIFYFYAEFVRSLPAGTRVYIYNLPMFVNRISRELACRLLETGKFAGIKDSSGDWTLFDSLRTLRQDVEFQLLIGNESVYLQGRLAGADGIISGVAAAVPELMVGMDRSIASDPTNAKRLNERLLQFLEQINRFPSTFAIRRAAAVRGWKLEDVAVPLDATLSSEVLHFENWFRPWLKETSRSSDRRPMLMRIGQLVTSTTSASIAFCR